MKSNSGEGQVREMLRRIDHRGPDDRAISSAQGWTLGHARLSILDVANGAQPMGDPHGRAQIVHNGEIYNFRELRRSLGGSFETDSDTEVILRLHVQHERPDEWLPSLDGMFAFAIVDDRGLTVARDPLGIKPLYIGIKQGAVVFGSEIKAVLAVTDNIVEFPAGYVFTQQEGERPFRRIGALSERCYDVPTIMSRLQGRIKSSVKARMVSDVPLGVFLSGGLDSSIIAAVANQLSPNIKTFAVGMEDSPDLQAARIVAAHLGTEHYERVFTLKEAIEALPTVIYHLESFDAALVRSAVPNYFLAELASRHVKVALSGEGADELFAGYSYLSGIHGERLERELEEIVGELHNTNLQRCDRMSMAHGLEVRVPFLGDIDLVEYAMAIPVQYKLEPKRNIGKWILRKAFEEWLPQDVVWRKKEKFADGAGLGDQLADYAEAQVTDSMLRMVHSKFPTIELASKEEALYLLHFARKFPVSRIQRLIGRSRSL